MKDLEKIDIKSGKMTFSQRIDLGNIFSSDASEIDKFEKVFMCLHNFKPEPSDYEYLIEYLNEIIQGIKFWIEKETTLLNYDPTAEELRAGVRELSKNVGEFGTIKALAKAYSKDPDEILQWNYGKVFGILYTDLEEYKFQLRYQKVIEAKK